MTTNKTPSDKPEKQPHKSILRLTKHERSTYVSLNVETVRDKSLSLQAKGLLCLLLSMHENKWTVHINSTMPYSPDSRGTHTRTFRELESKGYACSYNPTGNNRGVVWVIAETKEILRQFFVDNPEILKLYYEQAMMRKGFKFVVDPPLPATTNDEPKEDETEDVPF